MKTYPNWFVYFNEYNQKPHRAFGTAINHYSSNNIESSARDFIANELGIYSADNLDLVTSILSENEKFNSISFLQRYNGIEILDSRLYVKMNKQNEVIMFGIGTNIAAGVGALIFSFIEDRVGSKKIIVISLVILIFCGLGILIINDKGTFWILGISLSLFFGPVQSASRVYFAKLVPDEKKVEFFGFYSLSGKITSFLGPWMFALLTSIFLSQRAGMSSVIIFLLY